MGLDIQIFDSKESPGGRFIADHPEMFFTAMLDFIRNKQGDFNLLKEVDPYQNVTFDSGSRMDLLAEWQGLRSLVDGDEELAKWLEVKKALENQDSFEKIIFVGD